MKYRLPEWLGGHICELVSNHDDGTITVHAQADTGGAGHLRLLADHLNAVTPSEPVDGYYPADTAPDLPFTIHTSRNLHVENLYVDNVDDNGYLPLRITDTSDPAARVVLLNATSALQLAAAFLRYAQEPAAGKPETFEAAAESETR